VSDPDVALRSDWGEFLRRAALVAALAVLTLLIWRLADVLLLAFGAVLVAILLNALAEPLVRRTRLGRAPSLVLAVIGLTGAIGLTLWLFGSEAAVQLTALRDLLPTAWSGLRADLAQSWLGAYLLEDLERLRRADGLILEFGPRLLGSVSAAAAGVIIVFFAGLYLAFHPQTYLGGVLFLVPRSARPRAEAVLRACGAALDRWLLGQLISMALVGATTGLGLWLAGVPSPLALGVLAGLGQFVPVVGPAVSSIPGLLLAAAMGPQTLAWALVVYVGALQLEANLITPLVLRQMAQLPMAVTLFAVLAMGVLLGPLGVLFATPLAVVAYVMTKMIYVQDLLGEPLSPPPNQGGSP
jgi:predicted PurR-regulated permease PerM